LAVVLTLRSACRLLVTVDDDARRAAVFVEYGSPSDFDINGYENWLPCHNYCNQSKGGRTSELVPGIKAILDRLRAKAKEVERVADSVALNIAKDKVFRMIFAGLEEQTITVLDLDQLLEAFVRDLTPMYQIGLSEFVH
jgi:hypothetical protein